MNLTLRVGDRWYQKPYGRFSSVIVDIAPIDGVPAIAVRVEERVPTGGHRTVMYDWYTEQTFEDLHLIRHGVPSDK